MKETKNKEKNQKTTNENKQHEGISIVEKFREYLLESGKTATTTNSYVYNVIDYLKHTKQEIDSQDAVLEKESILSFRTAMIESTFRAATINTKLNSLLSFNKYLIEEGYMKELIVDTNAYRITNDKLKEMREEKVAE